MSSPSTQADDLYELVTERTGKSLIITANRSASDWYSLFPNPVVAESILDRVVNVAHHVHMEGKSYRPNKRPGAPRRRRDHDRAPDDHLRRTGLRQSAAPSKRPGTTGHLLLRRSVDPPDAAAAASTSSSKSTTNPLPTRNVRPDESGWSVYAAATKPSSSPQSSVGPRPTTWRANSTACSPLVADRRESPID